MSESKRIHVPTEDTWLCPAGALSYGVLVLFLLAVIHGIFLHEFGWRWLGAIRFIFVFVLYGYCVFDIHFFKLTSETVIVYSYLGLRRKHIRIDNICCIYGSWESESPSVYINCQDGQVILLNRGRCKLCEQLITQIQMRLCQDEIQEPSLHSVLPEVSDSYRSKVLTSEWLWNYGIGFLLLVPHGLFLYKFLIEKYVN